MLKAVYKSLMATVILAVLVCGVYPLLVMGIGKIFFSDPANGGLIQRNGKVVGAQLIGQAFTKPEYFHGRPSAAGNGYDAANSSGTNFGPTNQKFYGAIQSNVEKVLKENPTLKKGEIPIDLVTSSGSGLDPHISPQGARVQVERVAGARGLPVDQVKKWVEDSIEGPQWGIFGESQVNVLKLNLALDEAKK